MELPKHLKRKASPVNPYKRLIYTHPYFVWSALRRFQVMDKLSGQDQQYRDPAEIASVLFSNWLELSEAQQGLVISCKIDFPLAFLRSQRIWVSEEFKLVANPHRWERDYKPKIEQPLNRWRSKLGPWFGSDTRGFTDEHMHRFSYESMDRDWGHWTGRTIRDERRTARAERIMAEYELSATI